MARTLKTPGATETNLQSEEQLGSVTDTSTEKIETGEQPDPDTTQNLEERLASVIRELASFKNDPNAMQERIAELKPELANPNLASEMAKRSDRTQTTSAKLTDKGWLV